jgi:hypothetical protein
MKTLDKKKWVLIRTATAAANEGTEKEEAYWPQCATWYEIL